MKKLYYSCFLAACLLVTLLSCKKTDVKKLSLGEWNPNLAVPLAHSTFDVYDIFAHTNAEDLVVIDPNTGLLALVYKSDIATLNGNQYVSINNFSENKSLSLSALGGTTSPSFSSTLSHSGNEEIDFAFDNSAQIKEFKFDDGDLSFNISSTFRHPVTISFSVPSLKKNGVIFNKTINVNASSGTASTATVYEDLTGYIADLTLGNTTSNKLNVNYQVTVNGNGNAVSATDQINIEFDFSSLKMDYAKGFFGTRNLAIPSDSVLLKVFQYSDEGHFELVNPEIRFYLTNSFGLPVNLNINQVKTININSGQVLNLLGYSQQHLLNYPSIMGDSSLTTIVFNKTNTTNLEQVVSPAPKYVTFDANAVANPGGNTGIDNFVTKDSRLKAQCEVELPLHGLAHSFKLRDTVNFSTPTEAENLRSVMFRLIIDNGFPINVLAKLRFLDENYQEVFTYSNDQLLLIDSAPVDGNGKVIANKKKITDIKLNENQIQLLNHVKYIEIQAEANTLDFASGKHIKIYESYKLNLKLSGQFEGKF